MLADCEQVTVTLATVTWPAGNFFVSKAGNWQAQSIQKCSTDTTWRYLHWQFDLYQKPLSEEACSTVLPVLAMVVMQRGKKSIICVVPCVAALIPVHKTPSRLSNVQRRQLHTEPHTRSISCHVATLSRKEPKEELNELLLTVTEIETSSKISSSCIF